LLPNTTWESEAIGSHLPQLFRASRTRGSTGRNGGSTGPGEIG